MMVREFPSLRSFVKHVMGVGIREPIADAAGRRVVALDVVGTAQHMIGRPEFFVPLAQSTVNERLRRGYTPYATLLRSGDYQRSFQWAHDTRSRRGTSIGSSSPIAPYHEEGTPNNRPPKRSVLIDPTKKRDAILFELFAKTYFLVVDA